MKRKFVFLTILLLAFSVVSQAQDCTPYFPFEAGTQLEISNYDKKGKLTSIATHYIHKKNTLPNGIEMEVSADLKDRKKDNTLTTEYKVLCENGIFKIDMSSRIPPTTMAQMEGMNAKIDVAVDFLEFPSAMKVGQTLPDGSITASMGPVNMTVKITDRKVLAEEQITTPAGSFDCVKVSSRYEIKTVVKIISESIEWYAENVGVVKSETYNKGGKLIGYSELSKFSK